jgi:hypothetical protein
MRSNKRSVRWNRRADPNLDETLSACRAGTWLGVSKILSRNTCPFSELASFLQ